MMLAKAAQRTLMGLAGVGTFYAAAQWSRVPDAALVEVVPASARTQVTTLATAAAERPPAVGTGASATAARTVATTLTDGAGPPLLTGNRSVPESSGDAFAKLSWSPPPPPPPPTPAPAPPPKPVAPTAPPVPFSFVGMVEKGVGKPRAFLAKGDALLIVEAGEVLENNTYRIDSLGPNQVVLTYLPLNMRQSIDIGGASK